MYKITREEASNLLNMSTRSIDRYIRAWKLRSKKDGKIVYIHHDDVNNFLSWWKKKQEIIYGNMRNNEFKTEIPTTLLPENLHIMNIFDSLRSEIKQKDEEIKEMSIKIWQMQEIVNNSISLLDFKKTQFLLEESKSSLSSDLENIKKELDNKNILLKEEKNLNFILIFISFIVFFTLVLIWFIKI